MMADAEDRKLSVEEFVLVKLVFVSVQHRERLVRWVIERGALWAHVSADDAVI